MNRVLDNFEPRKITRPLRDYYVTFADVQKGRKVSGASAEHAARIFLGSVAVEGNERELLVGTQEMWRKGEFYVYALNGIPSPSRRYFECYITEIVEGEVFYIFQCTVCEFERVYGNAIYCARPETTIARLICRRCSQPSPAARYKLKHTLHRFVEIASPAMAKRISKTNVSKSFSKSFESGLMADVLEQALNQPKTKQKISRYEGGCAACGKLRGDDGTSVRCRQCADADKNRKRNEYHKAKEKEKTTND